jgi:hypothetical protein
MGEIPRAKHVDRRKAEEASGVEMAVTGSRLIGAIAHPGRRCPTVASLRFIVSSMDPGNFTYKS